MPSVRHHRRAARAVRIPQPLGQGPRSSRRSSPTKSRCGCASSACPGIREYGWHHATLTAFAAPIAAGRVLNLDVDQMVQAIGISAARTFCPGAVTAGKLTNMKNTVDPWATRMGVESALLAKRGYSGPEHMIDGKEGLYAVFGHVDYKGTKARFENRHARSTTCRSRPATITRSSTAA